MKSINRDLSTSNLNFVNPINSENKVLVQLDKSYEEVSEMSPDERAFLNALILRTKPQKLLELGVSAGGSSIIMLNAIKDFPDATLHSIDLFDSWFRNARIKTGYFVEKYPELKSKWKLYTGGLALKFMGEIGHDIDFCLIDTAHTNPGEILDVLMVLPFLKDDAIIVFHDVALHTKYFLKKKYILGERFITTNLLMSSIIGFKYLQGNYTGKYFPNISGIKINEHTKLNVFDIFNLLIIKWTYILTEEQEQELIQWFEIYYDKYYVDYLKKVFFYQKQIMLNDRRQIKKIVIKKILGKKNIKRIKSILGKV